MLGEVPGLEGPMSWRKGKLTEENSTIFIPFFFLGHLLIPDMERENLNWAKENYQESDKPEDV